MRRKNTSEGGFTLIELLVVIAVIAIIVGIAVPALADQRKKSIDARTLADVKNIATGIATLIIDVPQATHYYVDDNPDTGQPRLNVVRKPVLNDASTWTRASMPTTLSSGTHIALVTSPALSPTDPNRDPLTGGATAQYKAYAYNPAGKNYSSLSELLVYDSYRGGMHQGSKTNPTPASAIWYVKE